MLSSRTSKPRLTPSCHPLETFFLLISKLNTSIFDQLAARQPVPLLSHRPIPLSFTFPETATTLWFSPSVDTLRSFTFFIFHSFRRARFSRGFVVRLSPASHNILHRRGHRLYFFFLRVVFITRPAIQPSPSSPLHPANGGKGFPLRFRNFLGRVCASSSSRPRVYPPLASSFLFFSLLSSCHLGLASAFLFLSSSTDQRLGFHIISDAPRVSLRVLFVPGAPFSFPPAVFFRHQCASPVTSLFSLSAAATFRLLIFRVPYQEYPFQRQPATTATGGGNGR